MWHHWRCFLYHPSCMSSRTARQQRWPTHNPPARAQGRLANLRKQGYRQSATGIQAVAGRAEFSCHYRPYFFHPRITSSRTPIPQRWQDCPLGLAQGPMAPFLQPVSHGLLPRTAHLCYHTVAGVVDEALERLLHPPLATPLSSGISSKTSGMERDW